ncbi:MAG: hypothetical protein OEZ59_08195, partial [Deltaproteobacteria bacterium]|nr:hypothetical protein [Deltaproteobacteria bacterium]
MEETGGEITTPPWENPDFFSEQGLKDAQEYFFQTHATTSQLIAEGRAAQGISKSFVRRKLSRQMGDDFKMYTGANLGEASDASKGIRGELNNIIGHIYKRLAPTQAPSSPIYEDLKILKHPQGALEVLYSMVFYYSSLMKSYASMTSKRQTLRSILDEELFKWIWRMTVGYFYSGKEARTSTETNQLSLGQRVIPREKQQACMGEKLHEVGMFLLSKTMQDSQMRFQTSYYFVTFLRLMQLNLIKNMSRQETDGIYTTITKRTASDPITHPLVAIDILMNSPGNSLQSFDDILRDQEKMLPQVIPEEEIEFIHFYDQFVSPKRVKGVLESFIPDVKTEEMTGQQMGSMMGLLLILRILPSAALDLLMYKLPGPTLLMVKNRIMNSTVDDVSKMLLERIKEMMIVRQKRGEKYQVGSRSDGKVAVVSTRAPRPDEHRGGSQSGGGSIGDDMEATTRALAAMQAQAQAREETPSHEAPRIPHGQLDERLILAWKISDDSSISLISLSALEVLQTMGREIKLLMPWVVMALQTGQVF